MDKLKEINPSFQNSFIIPKHLKKRKNKYSDDSMKTPKNRYLVHRRSIETPRIFLGQLGFDGTEAKSPPVISVKKPLTTRGANIYRRSSSMNNEGFSRLREQQFLSPLNVYKNKQNSSKISDLT